EGAPADSLAEPASDPSAYGSARALGGGPVAGEPQQADGGRGSRSRLPRKPRPIAGEPQQVESRGGFGASRLGSGTSSTPAAASAKRPQVVTDAEELEEVTVVSREYKLDMQAVQQVREFLLEVRDGF